MAGRRPLPRALKLVTGNPGKRRIPDDEPEPELGRPAEPTGLTKIGVSKWRDLAALLESEQRLTLSDGPTLEGAAAAYEAAIEAAKDARRRGLSWKERRQARKDARMQWDQYRKFVNDMCLSAGTRARAKVGGRGKATSKLEGFLSRRGTKARPSG